MVRDYLLILFFFQAEDGIRDLVRSRGLGDVYKRQQCGDFGGLIAVYALRLLAQLIECRILLDQYLLVPVSYTHLTLPTIYSV